MFSQILIHWYEKNKRNFPWRDTSDPYTIWISEIILQQTKIVQGYEYFLHFMERFPDVSSLAEADEDDVMKLWQGLGYYSRARNLHTAAKQIVEMGHFPQAYEEIKALKGVGNYTAAAISSFAFGLPFAVVDGNVYRVLSRYYGILTPIDSTEGKKEFACLAQELLDKKRPAEYNQAIMDFGAIQCTPQNPNCMSCPLSDSCAAYGGNLINRLPVKVHKTKVTNRYFHYMYVHAGGYTYINKRTGNDIWHSLYELPLIEADHELSDDEFIRQLAASGWIPKGYSPIIRRSAQGIKHVLSHQIIYGSLFEVTLSSDEENCFNGLMKIPVNEIDKYAVPRLISQLLEKLYAKNQ